MPGLGHRSMYSLWVINVCNNKLLVNEQSPSIKGAFVWTITPTVDNILIESSAMIDWQCYLFTNMCYELFIETCNDYFKEDADINKIQRSYDIEHQMLAKSYS